MTLEQTRERLAATIERIRLDAAATNHLARGSSLSESTVSTITFDGETTNDVTSDVLAYAEGLLAREWLAYDPSYQLSTGQAVVDELDQVPELRRLQEAVDSGRAPLDDEDGRVVAMIHRAWVSKADAITAYRLKGQGIATRRARGIRILVPRDGIFERVDSEVLYYEPGFDALVFGDQVLVTAITTVQRSLGSPLRAQAMAAKTFERATAKLAIEGAGELIDAVATDPAMVAKMAQLSRILDAEPEYAALLTTERILEFLDHNPHIPIATTGEGADRRLLFESSPQKRYLIVKALADDYLRSELSQRTYEVGSKVQLPD